jgi:hypothetical protein
LVQEIRELGSSRYIEQGKYIAVAHTPEIAPKPAEQGWWSRTNTKKQTFRLKLSVGNDCGSKTIDMERLSQMRPKYISQLCWCGGWPETKIALAWQKREENVFTTNLSGSFSPKVKTVNHSRGMTQGMREKREREREREGEREREREKERKREREKEKERKRQGKKKMERERARESM